MRLDLLGMKFWFKTTEPPTLAKKGANAYLWQKSKGQWAIVINKDKVSGKFDRFGLPRAIYDLKDDVPGVTDGDKLQKLINLSLQVWPNREYVLPAMHNKAALKWLFKPKAPGQNILRKAYVNEFYPKVNTKNQKAIADRMRHSVEVAIARRADIKADSALIWNQATLKAKCQAKYQNEDDRFALLRRKQVFALNAGYVKGVRKSTVTKYDLKQEDDGTWY